MKTVAYDLHIEILTAVEEEKASLEALQRRLAATVDPRAVIVIQDEIQNTKEQTELRILDIQLRHALRAGRTEVALQLERVIEAIKAPRESRAPLRHITPETRAVRPGR